ncbi:tetratricopeptide repeat protein [Stappia taiwanensis]|uniref:tetratricopeptide repeat protein n=1 Tax=Stappia taiwanensis TaxID=992267 RepID=UPI001FCE853E|nr:tetratricopeptide repeat protein [Stappia taiwanensis]
MTVCSGREEDSQIKTGGNVSKQEIEKGVLLRQAQQLEASVAHFRALMAQDPENVRGRLQLAASLCLVGAYEESLTLLDAVLEGAPENRAALVGKVDTLAHRQRFAEALASLDAVRGLYPDQLDLEIKRGVLLRQARQLDASVGHLRALVARYPKHGAAQVQLAVSLRLIGMHDESLAVLDSVLAAEPGHRAALNARVDTLAYRQQFAKALAALDVARGLYPDQLDLEIKRGVLLRQALRLDASVAHLRDLVAQHPERVDARLQLAVSLSLAGACDESAALLDAVLEIEPRQRATLVAKVDTLAHRQQFAEALDALGVVQALFPDHLDLKVKQGILLRQAQRLDESVAHLREFAAQHPEYVEARLQLAISLRLAGAHEESRSLLDAVLATEPRNRVALIQLAGHCLSCGDVEEALATNSRALSIFSDDTQLLNQRADILAQTSDREGTVEQLQALFRQVPQSSVVAQRLIDALVQNWCYDSAIGVFRRFIGTPVLDNNGRRQQVLLCLQYGEISKAIDLSRSWVDDFPDSLDAKLSFYLACCELPAAPVDLSTLESDLLGGLKGSSAFAIARARRRQFNLDFGGVAVILVGFLRENPNSVEVLGYLFQFLLRINKLDRCLDLVRGFPELRAPHLFDLAGKLVMDGRRTEADALLPRLEEAIVTAPALHVKEQFLRRMCVLQMLRNDGPALARTVDAALSLKNLTAANRHYFVSIQHGFLKQNDVEDIPENISSAAGGPSLKAILRGDGLRPMRLHPEDVAIARRISSPPDGAYEHWLKQILKGMTVRQAVSHCYTEYPEKLDELADLIDFPDIGVLEKHERRSGPFLVAGTHQGPNAVVWRLLQSFPKLRVASAHAQLRRDHLVTRAALRLGADMASTRELLRAVRAGSPVAATLDQVLPGAASMDEKALAANTTELQVFDFAPLRVPSFLPKLAWKMNLPSYWVQSYLADGRIRIELVRLPDADYSLDREAWIKQWIGAYGKLVEATLQSSPENLCLGAGLLEELFRGCGTRQAADRR